MAYYLNYSTLDGKFLSIPNLDILDGIDFEIEFESFFNNTAFFRPFGFSSSFNSRALFAHSGGGDFIRLTNHSGVFVEWTVSYSRMDFNKFKFIRVGSNVELFINDISQGVRSLSGQLLINSLLNQNGTESDSCGLKYLKFTVGSAVVRHYVNTTGTGTVWTDTVSGNNAAQVGTWPANDSEWVFYDAGGGGISATIAATMPQMQVSGSAGVTNPAVAATVSFNMPQMQVAASGNVAAPGVSASIAFAMPQMVVASSADNIAPIISASVAMTMPQMSVAVSGNVVAVGNSASVSFAMPQMAVAAAASNTVPVFAATIAATMPQMQVACSADVQAVAGVSANIALTMPQMVVSASASTTAPVISATISFTMPQMIAYVLSGEFDYYSNAGTSIEYVAASTRIETLAASTHIEYTL